MPDLDDLLFDVDANTAPAEQGFNRLSRAARREIRQIERQNARLTGQTRRQQGALRRLELRARDTYRAWRFGIIGVVAGLGFALVRLTRTVDQMTLLRTQLNLVTAGSTEYGRRQEELFQLAQNTRSQYEAVVPLFSRIKRATRGLVITDKERLAVVQATTQATQISGATTQEVYSTVLQLTQALASRFLHGDELRALRENAPRLVEAIAAGLDTSVGNLKRMGEEGRLVSSDVLAAILEQSGQIAEDFQSVERTIGQAATQLGNSLKLLVDDLNTFTGAGGALQRLFDGIRRQVDRLRDTVRPTTLDSRIAELEAAQAGATGGRPGQRDRERRSLELAILRSIRDNDPATIAAQLEGAVTRSFRLVGSGRNRRTVTDFTFDEDVLSSLGIRRLVNESDRAYADRITAIFDIATAEATRRREISSAERAELEREEEEVADQRRRRAKTLIEAERELAEEYGALSAEAGKVEDDIARITKALRDLDELIAAGTEVDPEAVAVLERTLELALARLKTIETQIATANLRLAPAPEEPEVVEPEEVELTQAQRAVVFLVQSLSDHIVAEFAMGSVNIGRGIANAILFAVSEAGLEHLHRGLTRVFTTIFTNVLASLQESTNRLVQGTGNFLSSFFGNAQTLHNGGIVRGAYPGQEVPALLEVGEIVTSRRDADRGFGNREVSFNFSPLTNEQFVQFVLNNQEEIRSAVGVD